LAQADGAQPGGAAAPAGPAAAFWYAGQDHHDARSLAAGFQACWDDAVDQLFRRRDPIWLGELRAFLQAHGLEEADRIVAAGTGEAPAAATLARLLLALDPGIAPRVGSWWLTPDGLAAAAQSVVGGRSGGWGGIGGGAGAGGGASAGAAAAGAGAAGAGARLAEIGAARVLRLWRGLAGMERAASIDERWHAGTEAFGRLVAGVSAHAGWPTPEERHRAAATLLLCAVHPDHERQLAQRLAAARRTAAKQQAWWAQLAAEGQRNPPAAVLAVMTADRARTATQGERQAARAADRQRKAADRQRRDGERDAQRQRRAAAAAVAVQPRYGPLPRAQSAARKPWVLAVLVGALLLYLWAERSFADALVTHYQVAESGSPGAADRLRATREASEATGWAVLLLVLLPAAHVITTALAQQGTRRSLVRVYAGFAAALDLVLGLVLIPAATLALVMLGAGVDAALDPAVASPYGTGEPWAAVGLLVPFGLVAIVLIVRSVWRLARVALGRTVAGPIFPGHGVIAG
jgi:hypothetical protein